VTLDLTDEETLALLNLLVDTIEADRYPMSPRIRLLREILRKFGEIGPGITAGIRAEAAPLCTATARSAADTGRARSWAGATARTATAALAGIKSNA
jgi:hypothetical protein